VFDHAGRGDVMACGVVKDTVRGAVMHIDRLLELGAPMIAMIAGSSRRSSPRCRIGCARSWWSRRETPWTAPS